ncbi:flagellar protein MotY [Oceanobacter mangrovi]|uniref:flagellar protein MotY n=1 Tax=Oceanobacter mangrovi TaxID=2862510 RepID=UPI001C8D9F27|nr:OmpA family protein [Oceanobacter mangrovi]
MKRLHITATGLFWRRLRLTTLTGLLGLLTSLQAAGGRIPLPLEYGLDVQDTRWLVSGSIFECRFEQPIPTYGSAVFVHKAGEDVSFQLEAINNMMDYSPARISLLPPPWRPSEQSENMGTAKLSQAPPLLALDARRSNVFLHGLLEGKRPTISHKTRYDTDRFVRVYLSNVTFQDFYPVFLECVSQLLPLNFDQVARRKVFFPSGGDKLDKKDLQSLDQIIYYIQHDPRVNAVYLDGHADNQGRRYDNRQISKSRVEAVERYLVEKGIDATMLTTRFHGDRYPVASNKTAQGRAENRRVTIRLEMDKDMAIPDELLFKPKPRN